MKLQNYTGFVCCYRGIVENVCFIGKPKTTRESPRYIVSINDSLHTTPPPNYPLQHYKTQVNSILYRSTTVYVYYILLNLSKLKILKKVCM